MSRRSFGGAAGFSAAALVTLSAGTAAAGVSRAGPTRQRVARPPRAGVAAGRFGLKHQEPVRPGWRRVSGDCFQVQLPIGFKRYLRQKPDPWRPWIGRWGFRKGAERFVIECRRPGAVSYGMKPGALVRHLFPRIDKWTIHGHASQRVNADGFPVRHQVAVLSVGRDNWLVTRLYKRFPQSHLDANVVLALPIKNLKARGVKVLKWILNTLGVIDSVGRQGLLRSVYGPNWKSLLRYRERARRSGRRPQVLRTH